MRKVSISVAGVILLCLALGAAGLIKAPGWFAGTTAIAGPDYTAMQRAAVLVWISDSAHGSGVLVSDRLVITAAHVVKDADTVTIRFHDGTEIEATVEWRGRDGPSGDIAGLRLAEPATLSPAAISCRLPDEGETLVAVGNPLRARAVSSVLRVASAGPWHDKVPDAIVVQGPLVFGMSGGPVFDLSGHVVGISQAIFAMRLGMSPAASGFNAVFSFASFCDVLPSVGGRP